NSVATGNLGFTVTNGTGPFNVPGRLEVGDTIVVNLGDVADTDGLPPLSAFTFTWQQEQTPGAGDWVDLADPVTGNVITGQSFTPTQAFALDELRLRVVGEFRDAHGIPEVVVSTPTDPIVGAAPVIPVDGIILGAIDEDTPVVTFSLAQLLAGVTDIDTPLNLLDIVPGTLLVRERPGQPSPGTVVEIRDEFGTNQLIEIQFIPAADFNGGVTFQFDVTDGVNVAAAEAILDVLPINDAPVASPVDPLGSALAGAGATVTFTEDQLFGAITRDANNRPIDVDGDRVTIDPLTVVLATPAQGTIVDNGDTTFTFTANAGFNGTIAVNFDLDDGQGLADSVTTGTTSINLLNQTATGGPVLNDLAPTETEQLTVNTATIADANGVGPLTFQWQSSATGLPGSFTDIVGQTNATFTPNQAQVGRFIQVVVKFTDGGGTLEQLVSSPTTLPTGDSITGNGTGQTHNGTAGEDIINGAGGNDTLNGLAANDRLNGGTGNDTVNGGDGNDTITWDGGIPILLFGGRDTVDGGNNASPAGDRFILNGALGAETFRVYARAAWLAVGGNTAAQIGANTEIVITRNGTGNASIIAELDNIEELTINGSGVSVPVPPGGAGGDTIQIIGNFAPTSLNFNTITIDGNADGDTVDISQLTSGHRVVFNTGGGNDTFVGPQRAQDVINRTTGDPLTVAGTDGNETINGSGESEHLSGSGGNDKVNAGDGDDTLHGGSGHDFMCDGAGNDTAWGDAGNDWFGASSGDDTYHGGVGMDTFYAGNNSARVVVNLTTGRASGDTTGKDTLTSIENAITGGGNDTLVGDALSNILIAGAGADRVNGAGGNDRIEGGSGNDDLIGGAGTDRFVFAAGFGNDVIRDFDANPNGGQDVIDVSAMLITAANFNAHVTIADTGNDVLVTIDSVNTIRMRNIANVGDVTVSDFVLFS
ncbi:MAG: cadherin-like domain-containing protein, partial [Hyphomicrobium sp.]